MISIDRFCASGVFDAPMYSQGIRVSQAQSILFLSGQVSTRKSAPPAPSAANAYARSWK